MIVTYIEQHGWSPTYSEIMGATGLASKSTVSAHLDQLEREGKLRLGRLAERTTGARTIALCPIDPRVVAAQAVKETLR